MPKLLYHSKTETKLYQPENLLVPNYFVTYNTFGIQNFIKQEMLQYFINYDI